MSARTRGWRSRADRTARRQDTVIPPEGVPLHFEIAPLGSRLAAQVIDILVTVIFAVALILVLAVLVDAPPALLFALFSLLLLAVRAPYYIAAELLMGGQTIGKRALGLRVISAAGRPLGAESIAIRNLMKEAEVFLPGTLLLAWEGIDLWGQLLLTLWIAALLAVALTNRRRQRLGDLAAGTVVIAQPRPLLLPDVAAKAARDADTARFTFRAHQLDHYGAYELRALETFLRADAPATAAGAARRAETRHAVIERIRAKIDYPERVPAHLEDAFLAAFYAAQREHLEGRQLLGDRRADKHYQNAAPDG